MVPSAVVDGWVVPDSGRLYLRKASKRRYQCLWEAMRMRERALLDVTRRRQLRNIKNF